MNLFVDVRAEQFDFEKHTKSLWHLTFEISCGPVKFEFLVSHPGKQSMQNWLELANAESKLLTCYKDSKNGAISITSGQVTFCNCAHNTDNEYTESTFTLPADLVIPKLKQALFAAENLGYRFVVD